MCEKEMMPEYSTHHGFNPMQTESHILATVFLGMEDAASEPGSPILPQQQAGTPVGRPLHLQPQLQQHSEVPPCPTSTKPRGTPLRLCTPTA